jgi:hypothetical protein
MSATKQRVKPDPDAKDPYLVFKRRVLKDTLLAENPPRALGIGMAAVAIVLGISVSALRWVEYQETVPVNLTLKTVDAGRTIYGEGFLQPDKMSQIQTRLVVQLELSPNEVAVSNYSEATISEIKTIGENSLYAIQVDLPAELIASSGLNSTFHEGMQVQGKILTQKKNLFDKLFSFFRMIAHSI